jgi:hypothetical protein
VLRVALQTEVLVDAAVTVVVQKVAGPLIPGFVGRRVVAEPLGIVADPASTDTHPSFETDLQ